MQTIQLKPGDMIETTGHREHHYYNVRGVYLGALGQDSLVHLGPLDQTDGAAGRDAAAPMVPLHMIELGVDAGIYRVTPKEEMGS